MHATTYGLDVAKRVFQMYWVDGDTGEIVNRRFGRDDVIQFLSRRSPGPGGARHSTSTELSGA